MSKDTMSSDSNLRGTANGVADEQENLTDHCYDGIMEYDNPMPGWWVWLFVASVVYSIFYLMYFESGMPGRSIHDDYTKFTAGIFQMKYKEIGDLNADRATLLQYKDDPKWLSVGRAAFKTNCVSCHGAEGQGGIGPNLTDDHWKNVKNIEDIATVIAKGANNGAMPAWENRLSHRNTVVLTAAYVASLRGTQPSNPKDAEGATIAPWPARADVSSKLNPGNANQTAQQPSVAQVKPSAGDR